MFKAMSAFTTAFGFDAIIFFVVNRRHSSRFEVDELSHGLNLMSTVVMYLKSLTRSLLGNRNMPIILALYLLAKFADYSTGRGG